MKESDKTDEQPICIELQGSSAELESSKAEHIKERETSGVGSSNFWLENCMHGKQHQQRDDLYIDLDIHNI